MTYIQLLDAYPRREFRFRWSCGGALLWWRGKGSKAEWKPVR